MELHIKITEKLRFKGYSGSIAALRIFVEKEKRITKDMLKNKKPFELIDRRWITGLLYKPLEKSSKISINQYNEVIKKYPIIQSMLTLLEDFKNILKKKEPNELSKWIKKAQKLKIKEINSFVSGVNGDKESILNAIKYNYNNGLAEGSVNKVKNIKRVMYGRNKFNLLRSKVLQLEALKSKSRN